MATRKELAERQQAEWEKALDEVCLCTPKHMKEREEVDEILCKEMDKYDPANLVKQMMETWNSQTEFEGRFLAPHEEPNK